MSEDMIQQEFYCSFIASNENVVIPFNLIQSALGRKVDYNRQPRYAGCDPARFGNDRTGFVVRQGGEIIHVEAWRNLDTVQTAGKAIELYRKKYYDAIGVDAIGLGAGVYDMLKNAGIPCVAVNVTETSAMNEDRFDRVRDELWWSVREWFEDMSCSISLGISQRERDALLADIQDIRYIYTPTGKIKIESKDDMKERLGFSPDLGDALCCTFSKKLEMAIPEKKRQPFYGATRANVTVAQEWDPFAN
jgi:phage terminase large subunit